MKKIAIFILTVAIVNIMAENVQAQTIIDQGNCGANGANLKWVYTDDGKLTISGSGAMADYGIAPWYNYKSQMTQLIIGDSVTTIGNKAFIDCSGFKGNLTIPNSITNIGYRAFTGCSNFTNNLKIGNSVTTIGTAAFLACNGFTDLIIENLVTTIGDEAFGYCNSLTSITIYALIPPTLGSYAFYGMPKDIPVYITCGTTLKYETAIDWDYFSNYQDTISLPIPSRLTVTQQNTTLELAWHNTDATNYKIYLNDTLLATVNTNTYTDSNVSNGTTYCYQIKAINNTDCESQLSEKVCETFIYSGIGNYQLENGNLHVYPNPTNGQLTIAQQSLTEAGKSPIGGAEQRREAINCEIYDISGRIVSYFSIPSSQFLIPNCEFLIDISGLQSGMYYLRVGNETVKIIKE